MESKAKDKIFSKIFFNKDIMKELTSFLEEDQKKALKSILKKSGLKDRKKQLKEFIKQFIIDFGKHQEKLKYRISDEGKLIVTTSVFNLNTNYLKDFLKVLHKETGDSLELDKDDLFGYLKVLPKYDFFLENSKGDLLRTCKTLVPYDNEEEEDEEEEGDKKYEMFYNMNDLDSNLPIDFSNKEALIERQKKILEIMNAQKSTVFYPLQFVSNINYWSIILCHGGYFACGFFLKDKVIDHKSDHKYVTRKKAGQRQIAKDKAKKIKTSIGAQIRRENEKKHQENIEYILKLNEEYLAKSDAIFLQAPGLNKQIFIGDSRPLKSFKKKIINIPFNVQKANYTNMMEIFNKLTNSVLEIDMKEFKKLLN